MCSVAMTLPALPKCSADLLAGESPPRLEAEHVMWTSEPWAAQSHLMETVEYVIALCWIPEIGCSEGEKVVCIQFWSFPSLVSWSHCISLR